MELFQRRRRGRKAVSSYRKGMIDAIYEGIPAVIMYQLLGGPFLTGYLLYIGATSFQIGIVLAIPSLANMLQIVGALLIQRYSDRRLAFSLLCGFHRILWTLTGIIPFVVPQQYGVHVYIAICMFAFASQAIGSVFWTSLLADMVPAQVRGRYLGIRNTILWAGGCAAILIFGQILDRVPESQGFQILYAVAAVCAVLDIILFFRYPNPSFQKSEQTGMTAMLSVPFRNSPFLKAMLFISLWLFLQGISIPFFNYVMLDVMKLGYHWISMITIVQYAAMIAGYYVWGNLNAKYSSKTLLFWTLPIIASASVLWAAMPVAADIPLLVVIHMLIGFGVGGFNQMMFNYVIGDTPKSERPMYIAVFYAITGLAGFMGPLLGGLIYKAAAEAPLWVQLYGISLAVGIVLLAAGAGIGSKVLLEGRFRPRSGNKFGSKPMG